MAVWEAPSIWKDGECWIIGGGTSVPRQFDVPENIIQAVMVGGSASAYSPYLAPLHSKHVIGVNNAYKIGDWIDTIFFGDCSWYLHHKEALYQLRCLKVTCCDRFAQRTVEASEGIKYLAKDRQHATGISTDRTKVAWNNNSGAAAINLAVHFGVRRIVLLGFDMTLDSQRFSHWHGSHATSRGEPYRKLNVRVPPFARHAKSFPAIAEDARSLGVEILNASPISTLSVFPKVSVKDLL